MTNKDDKKKQEELRRQQEADRAARETSLATASQPPPLEPALTAETQNWLDVTSGKAGPFDVNNLTAMTPHLGLYRNAVAARDEDARQGIGALRLGLGSGVGDANLAANLAEQRRARQQERAAGGLEEAFERTDAKMRGQAFPLMGQAQGRSMGIAGLRSGQAGQSQGLWANFRPRPSFLSQVLLQGMENGRQGASAAAGGGYS